MDTGLIDGATYTLTLTFTATDGAQAFKDVALIDRHSLPPEIIGRFLIHLGNQTLSGDVTRGQPQ